MESIGDLGSGSVEADQLSRVINAAREVLKNTSSDSPMQTKALIDAVQSRINDKNTKGYVIYGHLLEASKGGESGIGSRKGKGGGYFLIDIADKVEPTKDQTENLGQTQKEKTLEKHLWPVVAEWLRKAKQLKHVTHTLANLKSGGVWSNPDVIALTPIDDLGFFDVEILTAEVKPSIINWRYFFFEAVSHKRFSERSYFIARLNEDSSDELRELISYAERYGIGLVLIHMDQNQFESIKKWNTLSEPEQAELLDLIEERIPARYEPIPIREKIIFMRRIGVTAKQDLYRLWL